MKNNKSFIMMALVAMIAVFSACSEDGVWEEYAIPADGGGDGTTKYSFMQAKASFSLDASATDASVKISRTDASKEFTLPLKVTVSDSTALIAPQSVTFKAGETQTDYTIKFNNLVVGETYKVDLEIDSALYASPGAKFKSSITIKLNYTWISLGKGGFEDNFWIGGPFEVEILQAEGFPIYRVMHPYDEGYAVGLAAGDFEAKEVGKPTEYIEFEVDEDGLVYYDIFPVGYLYEGEDMVYAYPPQAAGLAPDHNCQISEGVFQMAPYYYIPGLGGWNKTQTDGMILIYLPGYVPAE